jgi:translation initiation factor 2B subunit (eIF-2B alpha/beta/delta family)
MTTLVGAFNNHLTEFIDDLISIFPDDGDIKMARTAFANMKSFNPTAVIKIWFKYISKYADAISGGDISFFIDRDYSADVDASEKRDEVQRIIDKLRNPVRNMGAENQAKAMKYIQNLTKISTMYISQKQ